MAVTDNGRSSHRGVMDRGGSMVDKHQAFVFESYSNKRQFQSLMGVFIKSTWLCGVSPLPLPPPTLSRRPFLSASPVQLMVGKPPGSGRTERKTSNIYIYILLQIYSAAFSPSETAVTPEFFFPRGPAVVAFSNTRPCGPVHHMCQQHFKANSQSTSSASLPCLLVSRGCFSRFRSLRLNYSF